MLLRMGCAEVQWSFGWLSLKAWAPLSRTGWHGLECASGMQGRHTSTAACTHLQVVAAHSVMHLPKILCAQDAHSPSSSDFQTQLATYVAALELPEMAAKHAEDLLKAHDFSSARAALIISTPGTHTGGPSAHRI